MRLAAQITVQVEEHGSQPIRQLHGIDGDYGHFVTYGNEMMRPRGDPWSYVGVVAKDKRPANLDDRLGAYRVTTRSGTRDVSGLV
jgi:hypothetical protein